MRLKATTKGNPPAADFLSYQACKDSARQYAKTIKNQEDRLKYSRAFCATVIVGYWATLTQAIKLDLKIKSVALDLPILPSEVILIAERCGEVVAKFPTEDSGYLIGSIYTAMLPTLMRAELGAFYTPPPLVNRLLDLAELAGFNFAVGNVLDPACGGGAFLAPVALRMIACSPDKSAREIIDDLGSRLHGFEIDPFAAWMTSVLLDAALLPIFLEADCRLKDVVTITDSLALIQKNKFDLVVGNPPYGRVTLSNDMRERYSRSLFGHANLYGLFMDLALRLVSPAGVVAYITPTSFLGGQYFKALRALLSDKISPVAFDFVADRNGVFDDVQQETMLTAYTCNKKDIPVRVSVLVPQGLNAAHVSYIGSVNVAGEGRPWIVPREAAQANFLMNMAHMATRISDLGYRVSTGPFVWNRHKNQIKQTLEENNLPLIWAECVTPKGFCFNDERRSQGSYVTLYENQSHLVANNSCVLVRRTSSKEQKRRLVAAVLSNKFIEKHGGVCVENHLNIIQAVDPLVVQVSPGTVAALLNSDVVDRAFRCISGSTAVSAYEINALPLPSVTQIRGIGFLVDGGAGKKEIEAAIELCYSKSTDVIAATI